MPHCVDPLAVLLILVLVWIALTIVEAAAETLIARWHRQGSSPRAIERLERRLRDAAR